MFSGINSVAVADVVSHKPICSLEREQQSCFYYLSDPPRQNSRLIIFAHGFRSTLASTWGNLGTGKSWPDLVRSDNRFRDHDVYLMSYPSACLSDDPNIHETAKNELARLVDLGIFENYEEIYVIAHSMGGLVVKSLLTRLNRPNEKDIAKLRRVKATIFLGTPSQGADLAKLGKIACFRNPQVRDMEPASMNTWLSALDDSWSELMKDRPEGGYPRSFCAFETKNGYGGVARPVPREATRADCDSLPMGLALAHPDLAVPTSIDHNPYFWTMGRIRETAIGIKPHLQSKTDNEDGDIIVYVECDIKGGESRTLPLHREQAGVSFWQRAPGVSSQNFQSAGPPGEKNNWTHYPTGIAYVCQLTNYGKETLSNLKITFGLRFKEVLRERENQNSYGGGTTTFIDSWECSVRKLDPGPSERFVFYLRNETKDFLEVSMPEFIELRRLRESKPRKVPLLRHDDENTVLFLYPIPWPPRDPVNVIPPEELGKRLE